MKAARRAARNAAFAAQEDAARRARANASDLTVYFAARQRADAVDEWLAERVAGLRRQADQRRAEQLRQCGVALAAMKVRGESVREIARMTDVGEKAVRELIRAADSSGRREDAEGAAVVASSVYVPAAGHVVAEGDGLKSG